ncbi:MAG: hypothetical protein SynsKO_09080 [Synoicihabitans sp.]
MPDEPTIEAVSAALPSEEDSKRKRRKGVVDRERLRIDPALLDTPLAKWWQRAGAMIVDLGVVGALSLLSHPYLGLLTGATLAVLGTRRESRSKVWLFLRWGLIALGAVIIVLSGFLLAGKPLVRTGAFNLAPEKEAPDLTTVVVSPNPSNRELQQAVNRLEAQVEWLNEENARLRDEIRGNSWLRLAADTSRTMGFTFGWAGVYFTLITLVLKGRTVGKLVFGSRVVRLDGQPINAMDSFIRYGGYAAGLATGMLGFARLLWDPNRQTIQDRIAGTVVVSGRKTEKE